LLRDELHDMAALDEIRSALLALSPTGPSGFEGLLGAVLEQIAGQPFRLARSGLQAGRDGDTLNTTSHLSYECKLYTTSLNNTDVQAKITQLIGSVNPPDVWVLAATVEAGGQLVGTVEAAASRVGLGVLVLDWPATSAYPPLAVALAMAAETTADFFGANISDAAHVARARLALDALRASPDFEIHAQTITSELRASSLGMANARAGNREWLSDKFSDRAKARAAFGQALAPEASGPLPLRPREALATQLRSHLLAPPSRSVLAVVGGEGNGKSWLTAEAWLEMDPRPLMLVVSAADMNHVAAYGEFTAFLIGHIIRQSSGSDDDRSRRRWQRRTSAWADAPNPTEPRFVLWIDGLNEQPGFEWQRWIDDAAANIEKLGGVLVVTVRQGFYNERLRHSLNTPIIPVSVPEWALPELDELLRVQGVDPQEVATPVRERLRNPRILGIASRLLSSAQIQSFTELSVERLLYEHIRASDSDTSSAEAPSQFERRLAEHAREIIERVKAQRHDDRLVFDQFAPSGKHVLTAEKLAAAADHFFETVPGDPTLYTLPDDALGLALGFAILQALRSAERNGRPVDEALNELLEPIAALDKTTDAMFSALLVASVDERISTELKAALFVGIVGLQNINAGYYDPFIGIVRASTKAALTATERLLSSDLRPPNESWLTEALRTTRSDPECAREMEPYVRRWLRKYSLKPSLSIFSGVRNGDKETLDKKVEEQAEKLTIRLAALTVTENVFLSEALDRDDGPNPARFHRAAYELLAGMPLANFARDLVACAFSTALNSSIHNAYKELVGLIRFNQADWAETRDALLRDAELLYASDASPTAKWALVHLLRALSRNEDGWRAHELVEELTADRETFAGWRLIESYSATDPCDPTSIEADNVEQAAQEYARIDASALTRSRSMGREDHIFKDARPAMARFRPEVAVQKVRDYTRSALSREAELRRLGICSLEPHSAALDVEMVAELLATAAEISEPRNSNSAGAKVSWITTQYAIQASFPHLTGDAQLDYMMGLTSPGSPLIKFGEVVKPANPEKLATALQQALASQDENRALAALSFAMHSGTPLNDEARVSVEAFIQHPRSTVRAIAFDIIAHADDLELLQTFVASDWLISRLDPREESFERWYGSLAVIEAAHKGLLPAANILDSVVPELFGYAASRLGEATQRDVAVRIHAAFTRGLEIELPYTPPLVTQRISDSSTPAFGFFDIIEPEDEDGGLDAFVRRTRETDEEFDARHRSYWESFRSFEQSLTRENARIIIEDVGREAVAALISAAPDVAQSLARELVGLDRRKAYRLANFALRLSQGLSETQPAKAKALFERFADERGVVTHITGASSVTLAALTIWQAADNPEMDAIRTARLDAAKTDHDIAQEVIAALRSDKSVFLEAYAQSKLQSPVPADNARGMMVMGFGPETPFATEVLSRPTAPEGLLGKAQRAAQYAYERNVWAKFWYEEMAAATSPEQFWRASVLFLKIVDSRCDMWGRATLPDDSVMMAFEPGLYDEIRRRSNTWKTHREKTLCGDDLPSEVFLQAANESPHRGVV
jgi:hypothetical protein